MLVSGRNAPQTWDLRCFIRERMLDYLQSTWPEMLPRTRVRLEPAPDDASLPARPSPAAV